MLQPLDGQVRGIGDVHLNAVESIIIGPAAGASRHCFHIDVVAATAWVNAGEDDSRAGVVARRR